MSIDKKSNQTILSTTYAGNSELITAMKIVWQQLLKNTILKEKDGIYLYINGQQQGEVLKGEINDTMRTLIDIIKQDFQNEIIQKQRSEFVQLSIEKWIDNAIQAAYFLKQNVDYVIMDQKITPYDKNTGSTLQNVSWDNGLHQFLQIKHGLTVSPESMASVFISNISYFKKYDIIYGLTGTLGSQFSRQFLKNTYQVKMYNVPPYFQRKLITEPNFLMFDSKRWMQKIIERCNEMINIQNRAVLIICQSIQKVNLIYEQITLNKICEEPKTCITGEQRSQPRIFSGQVIVATNIAGRGMDLKPNQQLIQCGGLHVIITFMPENLRVEMQARGRAARNGAPGSGQLIVNYLQYCNNNPIYLKKAILTLQQFKQQRYQNEIYNFCQPIRRAKEKQKNKKDQQQVKRMTIRDEKFNLFCQTVGRIPDYQSNHVKRKAIEQHWSIFLKRCDNLPDIDDQLFGQMATQLIKSFEKKQQTSYYNLNHNFQRGFKYINYNQRLQASKMFKQLQNEKNSSMQQFSGHMGQAYLQGSTPQKNQLQTSKVRKQVILKLRQGQSKINQRRQLLKGQILLVNSVVNNESRNFMQGQNQKRARQLKQSVNKTEIMMSEVKFSGIKNSHVIEQREQQQLKHTNPLLQHPEMQILDNLQKHIQSQIKVLSEMKQNQTFQVHMQYFRKIVQKQHTKDNTEQQAVLKKIQSQIALIPKVKIKKKQSSYWKRAVIFATGVAQIWIGALLITQTYGLLAPFAKDMMLSGIKSCFSAIYDQQICKDLQQFFTKKSLDYGIKLTNLTPTALNRMRQLQSKSLKIINNATIPQLIKRSINGLKEGLVNSQVNWQLLIKDHVFPGINYLLNSQNNNKKQLNIQQLTNNFMKQDIKELISSSIKDEKDIQKKARQKLQQFSQTINENLRQLIERSYDKYVKIITTFPIKSDKIQILIQLAFNQIDQTQSQIFGKLKCKQTYQSIQMYLRHNIFDIDMNKVVDKFISKFQIKIEIDQLLIKLSNDKSYQQFVQGTIKHVFIYLAKDYKEQLKRQKQRGEIRTEQYNKRYRQFQTFYQHDLQNYINQPQQLIAVIDDRGVMDNEQNNEKIEELQFTNLHPILISMLRQLSRQYGEDKYKVKQLFVQNFLKTFNQSFTYHVLKIIPKCYDAFSYREDSLNVIQSKLINAIKKGSNNQE